MIEFTVVAGISPAYTFVGAHRLLTAETLPNAERALDEAHSALNDGYWIAGSFSYEWGVRLGIFDPPSEHPYSGASNDFRMSPLQPLLKRDDYDRAIERIHRAIYEGDVYQVNYTVPFAFSFDGDPWKTYERFAPESGARYCAFVRDDDRVLLSFSPELFLEFQDDRVVTRPMKGTAPLEHVADLESPKNHAEHLMIVDLLRNDFHHAGLEVSVENLFHIEEYPTFATMTSTITGRAREALPSLKDVWRAVFPCGSVTGAPKIAAMQQIAALELQPRGAYCGSIGFLSPQRKGWWNVAIRTAQLDCARGIGRYDAGGGIVSDSNADSEWAEVLLKTKFFRELVTPFELLETFSGDMETHLLRLRRTAEAFDVPFDDVRIRTAIERMHEENALIRVRLASDGSVLVVAEPRVVHEEPVRVCLSNVIVQSGDPMLRWKTSWRPAHERAAREARDADCFESLLSNERGEITEGTRTNVFARIDGLLYTPPLSCGLLPGILRQRLISENAAMERVLVAHDVRTAQELYVGNSARGLLQAQLVASRISAP